MAQQTLERLSRAGVEPLRSIDIAEDLLGFHKTAIDGIVAWIRESAR